MKRLKLVRKIKRNLRALKGRKREGEKYSDERNVDGIFRDSSDQLFLIRSPLTPSQAALLTLTHSHFNSSPQTSHQMTRFQRYPYKTPPHRQSPRPTPGELLCSLFSCLQNSLVAFVTAFHHSKTHPGNRSRFQTRTTNTNRHLRFRAKLGAIKEEPEELDSWQARDLFRQLDGYRDRSEINNRELEEGDEMAWDYDETTLAAMLEDECVFFHNKPTAYMLLHTLLFLYDVPDPVKKTPLSSTN
jgi:hypothetical protein